MSLKTVEEHNREARERYRAANEPKPTGIACSECGAEMLDHGGAQMLSIPPQKMVSCPKCGCAVCVVA